MQNVLCRFRCETSPPKWPGLARPTRALRFAPSTYTWPPASCTAAQMSATCSSNTPCVDGYVIISTASSSPVLLDLRPQVLDVDLAVLGGLHDDDLHAGHHGAGRVRAVRGGRDEADGALLVAVGPVVAADGEQTGQLALRAGVRLERHLVVAGDLGEPLLQLADEREVALRLLGGREGVQLPELRPGDRLHLGGGVELHRAGAQRDHAAVERVVTVGEPAQVAQHRGLGAVLVEDRVREVVVGAQQRGGQRVLGRRRPAPRCRPRRRTRSRRRPVGPAWWSRRRRSTTWSASTRRRLTPASRAAATTSAARPGTRTVSVSK